jgi:hypothetical protein
MEMYEMWQAFVGCIGAFGGAWKYNLNNKNLNLRNIMNITSISYGQNKTP